MKTMSARDAKAHFGELMDAMQREPVVLTKNNRPVGIFISLEDAADSLIPEMFMEKEPGYDEWVQDIWLKLMALKLQLGNPGLTSSGLPYLGKLELPKPHSQAGAWERATEF